MKKNVCCGFVLTCAGDERAYSFVSTPYENTLADQAMLASLFDKKTLKDIILNIEVAMKDNIVILE